MRNIILTFAILLLSTASAQAQKNPPCHNDGPDRANCGQTSASTGPTTSPIEPRMETDSRFIINGGGGLDTGCTFRNEGSLVITLPVTRVVGETNGDGTLKNPQKLIDNGLITSKVILRMPAFDVDRAGAPGLPPEIDKVLLNGVEIGTLNGANNIWLLNDFTVDVNLVRFATKNSSGVPTPGNNEITILIDQASGTDINWCTAIDWVELVFTAMYPVVLVHGNESCPEFFSGDLRCDHFPELNPDQIFTFPFTQQGVLVDSSIRLQSTTIEANGVALLGLLPPIAISYGVKHLHVIAHSKGGLNMRDFVTRIPTDDAGLGLLSLITLSTPHAGSAGADYQMDARAGGKTVALFSTNPKVAQLVRTFVPPNNGTPDLRVSAVKAFNDRNLPLLKDYFIVDGEVNVFNRWTVAADGNINDSRDESKDPLFVPTIQQFETVGLPPRVNIPGRVTLLELVYRTLGTVQQTSLERRTVGGVTGWGIREQLPPPGTPFELNDFAVTLTSAHFMPNTNPRPGTFRTFERANHATIANSDIGARVLEAIKFLQPIRNP